MEMLFIMIQISKKKNMLIKYVTSYVFDFDGCSELNIEKLEFCGIVSYCEMYKTRDGCVFKNR
jgi:hypothetical protein